jgi:ABC-type multidrug transport system permease subunit
MFAMILLLAAPTPCTVRRSRSPTWSRSTRAVSPIRRFSILLGRIMADAITMLVQGAIILAVALLLGAHVKTGFLGALGLLALAVAAFRATTR